MTHHEQQQQHDQVRDILRDAVLTVLSRVIERNERVMEKMPAERNELAKYVASQARAIAMCEIEPFEERIVAEVNRLVQRREDMFRRNEAWLEDEKSRFIDMKRQWEQSDESTKRLQATREYVEIMLPLDGRLGQQHATQVIRSRGLALAAAFGLKAMGTTQPDQKQLEL
jgi:hypothetical protein